MAPPTPFHVLRSHSHPIHAVFLSPTAPLLYAGDQEGHVSITDLGLRRVVAFWKAHEGGVLGVGEWEGRMISHGRDNLIHIHEPFHLAGAASSSSGASSTLTPLLKPPAIQSSLDVNALNFCRFSLAEWPGREERKGKWKGKAADDGDRAFIAVPNLTDSESVDIYALPSLQRIHAAIGHNPKSAQPAADAGQTPRSGLIMSLHVYFAPVPGDGDEEELRLVVAYEDGRVELWACEAQGGGDDEAGDEGDDRPTWQWPTDARLVGAEGQAKQRARWRKVWRDKVHNEAIMAMAVSPLHGYAFTVSADHQLVQYALDRTERETAALTVTPPPPPREPSIKVASTKQIGNSSVAVMPDGRVVAVGGWDGSVRLFSARSLKPLGTLPYHRQSVDAIAFAGTLRTDEDTATDAAPDVVVGTARLDADALRRWMITGSKDRRVALWGLKNFERQ